MTSTEAKAMFAAGDITIEQYINVLETENAQAKHDNSAGNGLKLKVSEKGGLSVYGLGRFPVTLYREQWERLIEHTDAIKAFLADSSNKLTSKDTSPEATKARAERAAASIKAGMNGTSANV